MATSEKVKAWYAQVDHWAVQVGVSQSLILAVIQQESGGNPDAKRYEAAYEKAYVLGNTKNLALAKSLGISTQDFATSYGLMQLMLPTAVGYGCKSVTQLLDPDQNIRFGAAHLGAMIKTHGSKECGLAAYNGGNGGAADWKAGRDTQATRYVKSVMALYQQYRDEALLKQPVVATENDSHINALDAS
jgi:soluble lytic murein transglycosylase-like protein